MESLKELYRIGPGPSSSHTLAPQRACLLFVDHYPEAVSFEVELFGSLALTGVGHATDDIVRKTFAPHMCTVIFNPQRQESFANGLLIKGFDYQSELIGEWTVYSLGGGSIEVEGVNLHLHDEVYPHKDMNEILDYCQQNRVSLADYPFKYEYDLKRFLDEIITQMLKTVDNGLRATGILPGALKLPRIAQGLNMQATMIEDPSQKERVLLSSYAYAACEENAAGKTCVTAPTMGASGVLAALSYYYYHEVGLSKSKLIKGLAVAGIFGNVIKHNATISGAVGGCQAEIGTACAMASAMVAYINGLSNHLIAYAAEIGMEHHLGLTCDPVGGYVMIPCIERNAVAVLRAFDSALLAKHVGSIKTNRVSFDDVVRTMRYTGNKLAVELKETSLGGLATEIKAVREPDETKGIVLPEEEKMEDLKSDDRLAVDFFSRLDLDDSVIDEFDNKLRFK